MATKNRAIRIPDELWDAALAVADSRHETLSDVVREALAAYVDANTSTTTAKENTA